MNATETVNTAASVEVKSDELGRYEQALLNFRCARHDLIEHNKAKLWFHLKGLCRAILGV